MIGGIKMDKSNWPVVRETIRSAYANHWAIGQFNISCFEVLKAIVNAANEVMQPVIVGVSPRTIQHIGTNYLAGWIPAAKKAAKAPIYFHLDHGSEFSLIEKCIEIGFDSIMIDASKYEINQNIDIVRKVVELAHLHNIGVEGQVGETWNNSDDQELTEPKDAKHFVENTGIDYLAISVGETPGRLQNKSQIDIDRIKNIANTVSVPLVLHGGTSIPEEMIEKAIQAGVSKINIDTAIRQAATKVIVDFYSQQEYSNDLRVCSKKVESTVKTVVIEKIKLFNSIRKSE